MPCKNFRMQPNLSSILKSLRLIALILTASLHTSCIHSHVPTEEDVPADAYGLSSSPWPKGTQHSPATITTVPQFKHWLAQNGYTPAIRGDLVNQEEGLRSDDTRNVETIRALELQMNRRYLPPEVDLSQSDVTFGNGDTFINTFIDANGLERKVVTLGERQIRRSLANSIRRYKTRDNILMQYEQIYSRINANQRETWGLVDPAQIRRSPTRYSDQVIHDLNSRLVANLGDNLHRIPTPAGITDPPAERPATCDGERGAGTGGDRFNRACSFHNDGIYNNMDWNNKWFHTCVKDQANRGTCVAFANTAALEYHVARKFGFWENLSEQALYNQMKFVWDREDVYDGYGCERGFQMMKDTNWLQPHEYQWNYNPSNSRTGIPDPADTNPADGQTLLGLMNSCTGYGETCSDSTHQSQQFCFDFGFFRYCGYQVPNVYSTPPSGYRMTTYASLWDDNGEIKALKVAIAAILGTPVALEIPVTKAWDQTGTNGFMEWRGATDKSRGGHAVMVTGYVTNAQLTAQFARRLLPTPPLNSASGYFIVKNSWGTCFADGGYIYVPWEFVANMAYAVTALHGVQ
jgi:hypothetical protein